MSSPAASESLPNVSENASVLFDSSPRKSLDRREFLKIASGFAASIPISNLGRIPGLDTREGVGFWNAIFAIDQLNIDPSSVHLVKKNNSPSWNPRLSIEMTSKDPGNFNQYFINENPKAKAAKIELTFTGKNRQNHLDNIQTASHLAAFVIDAAILSKAVRAFEAGGMVAALSVYSDADQKFWTKEKKLGLVGGTLAIAGMACVITASEINQTQQTPEGIEATQALTSIPTQGDGAPLPTDNGGGVTLEVTPLPIIPVDFPGKDINVRYLQENGAKIQNPNPELQPSPTSVPFSGNEQQIDPVEYAKSVFNLSDLNTQDPLSVLKYLAAQGPREGTNGGITWYQTGPNNEENPAFAGLTVYREQTQYIEGEYTINEGYPKGLKVRNGSGISIIGRGNDGNIVISFEEWLEKQGRGAPRLRFAILTPNEFGNISKNFLDNCKYFLDSPDRLSYTNQLDGVTRTVMLNHIDENLMELIRDETGALWIDKDAKGTLFSWPVVPYPDRDVFGIEDLSTFLFSEKSDYSKNSYTGKIVEAISPDNQKRLYATFNLSTKTWEWKQDIMVPEPLNPSFSYSSPQNTKEAIANTDWFDGIWFHRKEDPQGLGKIILLPDGIIRYELNEDFDKYFAEGQEPFWLQLTDVGPYIKPPWSIKVPVRISEGVKGTNLLSVFNGLGGIPGAVDLDESGSVMILNHPPKETDGYATAHESNFLLRPNKWWELELTCDETGLMRVYAEGELITEGQVTKGSEVPDFGFAFNNFHAGYHGGKSYASGGAWIENGAVEIKSLA